MSYDLDRGATREPSLADMATRALDVLQANPNGYFLMVEGGRIDHALHDTNAKRALQDTIAFDNAIKATLDKVRKTDPNLTNTLIVVTADHDHTLVLNGYAARTGKTEAGKPGVLGVLRSYQTGAIAKDADGAPYT
ncbi:alkaline phosphatase, partial [Staphylococcus lugdunensis]|nr:alkaline phosphatase [Staphylococcus lugdunensis]